MVQCKAKILSQKIIDKNYFRCALDAPRIARQATPGQFINIRINDTCEPLLRRPLSIHNAKGSRIEIFYEVLGQGTKILSQKRQGEYLDVVGPLGNGFKLGWQIGRREIIVSGGMGVAPLVFLAERLINRKTGIPKRKILVLIGARTKSKILCEKEFKALGCQVKITTDDGSKGFQGKVTDLLSNLLLTIDYRPSTIYACGPKPMLKAIAGISLKYNVPAQVSLEEHMACGIGACLGCVVRTKNGYQRVCVDGPVFEASQIIW